MPATSSEPPPAGTNLRQAFDYWRSRHTEGRLPGRQHIDPVDIPALLPDMVLVDYADGAYRYRLAGTRVVERFGREITGRPMDRGLFGAGYESWLQRFEEVRRNGSPRSGRESLWWWQREHQRFGWLCLPLAADGVAVDKLMLCLDWH